MVKQRNLQYSSNFIGKNGGKITNVKRSELSLILVPVAVKRRVDGLPRSFSCGQGSGNGGKEMKIRYVFILLIIIVLALFKKMAD